MGHFKNSGRSNLPLPDPNLIKVCIVNTGYDDGHEDLPTGSRVHGNAQYSEAWSFHGHGHGTHYAGTIAALENNKGMIGVLPNVKLHIAKGSDKNGSGSTSGVMTAVEYCIVSGWRWRIEPK